MKKLLVLAAVSAMAMGAKATYYTVDSSCLPNAKAVYWICGSIDKWNNDPEYGRALYLDDSTLEMYGELCDGTWAGMYSLHEFALVAGEAKMAKGNDGKFTMDPGMSPSEHVLMVLTDATELSPGAAYSMYYGTSGSGGGEITIQGGAFETGFLRTDASPTPAPEPTSGLLLLLGVAGLALKRKRA